MKTLMIATISLISLPGAMAQRPSVSVRSTPVPTSAPAIDTSLAGERFTMLPVTTRDQRQDASLEGQDQQTVLVVPGPDVKPDMLAAITQDLTVMSRIFDKAVNPGVRSTGASVFLRQAGKLGLLYMQQTGRTQGLYLDGYGAVFFVQSDFPLVPPPPQAEGPRVEESADRVWSQTLEELRGQPQARDAEEAGPAYDPQIVESYKTTLIKTLRHAANLRIRPQDQITVVVGSRSSTGGVSQDRLRYLSLQEHRFVPTRSRREPVATEADPAATLVLRVVKSDLDALAAGKLTAEQFAPKVQTLWSTARPQAQPSSSTQPTSASR